MDSELDKRAARRHFSRAATGYDEAAVLQAEIGRRMLERLDYMRIAPRTVLDLGCGTGVQTAALMKRYPKARVLALDFALPMLALAAGRRGRWMRRPGCLCADLDRLPLADNSVDLVFSNAALQWSATPAQALAEVSRILRPGGLCLFSTFGPDTLMELRAAWADVDGRPHVHRFIDMHDYGDMMMAAGLADPVMDVERMVVTYADVAGLVREVKAIGATNVHVERARGLLGPGRLRALYAAYERFRDADGRLPASYEVVHGHAWSVERVEKHRPDGEVRVSVDTLRRRP